MNIKKSIKKRLPKFLKNIFCNNEVVSNLDDHKTTIHSDAVEEVQDQSLVTKKDDEQNCKTELYKIEFYGKQQKDIESVLNNEAF